MMRSLSDLSLPRVPLRSVGVAVVLLLSAASGVLAPGSAAAQQSGQPTALNGRVMTEGAGIPQAPVRVEGLTLQTLTNAEGRFLLRLPAGDWELRVEALGFAPVTQRVQVGPEGATSVVIELVPKALELDPIVITGTMRETRVSDSPVKVDVVTQAFLQRNVSDNLTQSISHVNGLYNQVDCGVCYTNSIRINGMEGPYTAVLIDGMPLMSSLSSVYGLNGIHPAIIEQLEILKGPSSTLYGTEAMGGVINIITKSPRFAPRYSVDVATTDLGERSATFALAPGTGALKGLVSGSLRSMDRWLDRNGDGFSDLPLDDRISLFGKLEWRPDGRDKLELMTRIYREDRFGGVRAWRPSLRGSSDVYGESILTERHELVGRYDDLGGVSGLRLHASSTGHRQDSYYGDIGYQAEQQVHVGNLTWEGDTPLGDLLVGSTLRWEYYDDNTPATTEASRRGIPGVFAQLENRWPGDVHTVTGARLDRHGEHGSILSPRFSAKWMPFHETTVRVNSGTGFRVVNLFTEDHAAYTGARDVIIREKLRPERSVSVTGNLNQILRFGSNPMMIDVDGFYTRFSNRIVPDYDVHPDQIVYDNLNGTSVTRGVSVSLNQNFSSFPLLYTVGMTFQDVYTEEAGVRRPLEYSARYKGVAEVSYTFPGPLGGGLRLDYTGSWVGPMELPEYPEPFSRPTRSEPYSVHNLQATMDLGSGERQLYVAARNLSDFAQGSPLIDPANPFGEAFDTGYVWGPIVGRQFLIGLRIAGSR